VVINLINPIVLIEVIVLIELIVRGGFALTLGAYASYLKSQKQHVTARE
jgi:hypothetical protein